MILLGVVADRFGFGAEEIGRMTCSRLLFWFDVAHTLHEKEKAAGGRRED